jgi:hypothetical protein
VVALCFSSSSSGSSSDKTNVPDLAGTPNALLGGYSTLPTPTQGLLSTTEAADFKGAPNLRIINLIATCLLLAFATSIYKTKTNKMPLEVDLANLGKEIKYVQEDNPIIKALTELFKGNTTELDTTFLTTIIDKIITAI